MTALPLIVVGSGPRARALWDVAKRSPKFNGIAAVTRTGKLAPGWPMKAFTRLEEALAAFPDAVVVSALPPQANLDVALALVEAKRVALIEAPLSSRLALEWLPDAASRVQVDHGWVNLPGRRWLEKVLAAQGK